MPQSFAAFRKQKKKINKGHLLRLALVFLFIKSLFVNLFSAMVMRMMMPMDCFRVMTPEFTKPTAMTVVAEELWIMAVTPRPVESLKTGSW